MIFKLSRVLRCLGIVLAILAMAAGAITFWPVSPVRETARRSVDSSNLRQIGQAAMIYAFEREDKLPMAENIWEYAGELARVGGLNDAAVWMALNDPANTGAPLGSGTVLLPDRRSMTSEFRSLTPSWAVALGRLNVSMPSTMPIAWTRGLRPDGTWSPYSPYGEAGGHIVFLGGNVAFYRNVKGELLRFDGTGKTSNILETLPPGTRIGEYLPSEAEQETWSRTQRWMKMKATVRPFVLPGLWLAALITLIVQVARGRWPVWMLVWFLVLSFLAAVAMPTAGRVREI